MKRTGQLLLLVAVLVGVLMAVSQTSGEIRLHSGGTRRHADRAVGITFYFGSTPRVYHVRSAQPVRPRAPVRRQGTYSRDPAGYWVSYYGGQAFRYGPHLYEPVRSRDGVRRYRRIWVGH